MSRRLPATRPPAPRVIHYIDPATPVTPAELAYPLYPAQLAAQQRQQQALYLRWKARQEAIAVRDRKLRRFWLGFGAVLALGVLTGLAVLGWLIWQALTAISLGALAVPVVILLAAVLGVGGHRCITVVQHWH
jgi:fatty acid desaturase